MKQRQRKRTKERTKFTLCSFIKNQAFQKYKNFYSLNSCSTAELVSHTSLFSTSHSLDIFIYLSFTISIFGGRGGLFSFISACAVDHDQVLH